MLKSIIDIWRVKNRIFVHDETLKNIFGTNRLDELCKSTAMEIRVVLFMEANIAQIANYDLISNICLLKVAWEELEFALLWLIDISLYLL